MLWPPDLFNVSAVALYRFSFHEKRFSTLKTFLLEQKQASSYLREIAEIDCKLRMSCAYVLEIGMTKHQKCRNRIASIIVIWIGMKTRRQGLKQL